MCLIIILRILSTRRGCSILITCSNQDNDNNNDNTNGHSDDDYNNKEQAEAVYQQEAWTKKSTPSLIFSKLFYLQFGFWMGATITCCTINGAVSVGPSSSFLTFSLYHTFTVVLLTNIINTFLFLVLNHFYCRWQLHSNNDEEEENKVEKDELSYVAVVL
jgi:hypothetical protein